MENKKNRRQIVHSDSRSLWNYTLSPGWSNEEVAILKLALQKFGIGRWKKIMQSKCLPGKSIGQIYIQTQRLIGQQSLGEFMGLHVDLQKIWQQNMNKTGVMRKNNCVINTGDNPTRVERTRRIQENKEKYSLTKEYIKSIQLGKVGNSGFADLFTVEEIESDKFTTIEKINELEKLRKAVRTKIERMEKEIAKNQNQNEQQEQNQEEEQKK